MIAWRIIVAMGMVIIATFVVVALYKVYDRSNCEHTEKQSYSDSYVLAYKSSKLRLKDAVTGEYLTDRLDYLYKESGIKDTLTVFRQDGKRGFLDVYTGKVIIPAQYDKAWVFSEGLGAAVKDGKLGFINKRGETVIPFQYGYRNQWQDQVDFLFKRGYSTALDPTTGKHGLIDKRGKWVIEPQYDFINNPEKGFRIVKLNEKYGVLDSALQFALPIEYDGIEFYEDGFLLCKEYEKRLVAYDGKTVLQPFVYDHVYYLTYGTDKVNDDGNIVNAKCDINSYEVAGRYGLMDKNGKIITKPLYTGIDAIMKDVFVCDIENGGSKITINAKGEVIK